jgi:hypothetical protein
MIAVFQDFQSINAATTRVYLLKQMNEEINKEVITTQVYLLKKRMRKYINELQMND